MNSGQRQTGHHGEHRDGGMNIYVGKIEEKKQGTS